ncbi:FMN-binding protein [Streptacidiphilus sp. PB12-B1b]|uniref:FMN-binding protein n=1 Tax=Streptacidiphilus sp. PB12-B1b TaxID=2705012 RepID=UPI0015FD6C85|nr:FMN-binding protein [Streptacidiphilus sp. PB12-B1b]QMU75882.1 FMN-binding protein [Streptacidiphilus sp. PB12-B1b]
MRRFALTAGGTAFGVLLLLAAKPHHTGTAAAAPVVAAQGASGPVTGVHTVTGGAVGTPLGPVQVRVAYDGSRITGVTVLEEPDGTPRDEQINAQAIPVLTQEVLAAQNADIDAVSGATFTSQGYIGSLQSAIDAAR